MAHVLVVDDERNVRNTFAQYMRSDGHEVRTAASAEEAIELLDQEAADVVVSDIILPGRSGMDLLAHISERHPDTRVILITGEPTVEAASAAVRSHAHDYISKPIRGQDLLRSVAAAARYKQLVEDNRQLMEENDLQRAELRRLVRRKSAQVRGARRALDASQARLRRIARSIPGVLYEAAWSPEGHLAVAYVGDNVRTVLRLTKAQVVETPGILLDMVHPDDRAHLESSLETAAEGLSPWTWEGRAMLPGGELRWIRALARPSRRRDGTVLFDGALFDVTEQRELQARLVLSDRMAAVGTLAAGMSHEINNPLTYVNTNLELLEEHLETCDAEDETRALVLEAREGVERVREIIADMRAFSHSPEDESVPADMRVVVESSIRLALVELRHRARLVRDLGEVPLVLAHPSRLGQVFVNLLVNAAQAIPEGRRDDNQVRITLRPAEGGVRISVADSGCGIPDNLLSRIFDPFFTTKPTGVGTGLGLYICQTIVTAHGGTLTAESQVGVGSTFHVWLPAARSLSPEAAERKAPREAVTEGGLRVLVIDDESLIGTSVRRILRGHQVKVCLGGEEGIAALEQGTYDVVLCDLIMPGVTEMDVFAWARTHQPELIDRMVFMTGGAFTARARTFLGGISNTTLDKPFDLHTLRQVIARTAGRAV